MSVTEKVNQLLNESAADLDAWLEGISDEKGTDTRVAAEVLAATILAASERISGAIAIAADALLTAIKESGSPDDCDKQ